MRRVLMALGALGLSATLVGCGAFYPNWGATGLPEEPELSISEQATASPEQSETSQTQEPEPTASEVAEETTEPAVTRKQVQVEIIMAIAEPDFGVLTVVAQIPGMAEANGKCVMRFIGSNREVSMEVRAEPSSDYTQCFPIEFPLADLPKGNGVVTVSYESAGHFGLSPASSVVIP